MWIIYLFLLLLFVGLIWIIYHKSSGDQKSTDKPSEPDDPHKDPDGPDEPSEPDDPDDNREQIAPLRITNNFKFPIWVEGRYGEDGTPLTPEKAKDLADDYPLPIEGLSEADKTLWRSAVTNYEIPPGKYIDYDIPEGGIAGVRLWAKYKCQSCSDSRESGKVKPCYPPYPLGCTSDPTQECLWWGEGDKCMIGDNSQYYIPGVGAQGGCPATKEGGLGCSVPIDSLLEMTFGCRNENGNCNPNPANPLEQLGSSTYFNTSNVDGFTFPYLLKIKGSSDSLKTCINSNDGSMMNLSKDGTYVYIDGSKLDVDECPTSANFSFQDDEGNVVDTVYSFDGSKIPIDSVNLSLYERDNRILFPTDIDSGLIDVTSKDNIIGCMSSCKKLNYGPPYGLGQTEACHPTIDYCCPTDLPGGCNPDDKSCCSGADDGCITNGYNPGGLRGCVSAEECSSGPVEDSDYVKLVHRQAPGVYAYAYDDRQGLYQCLNSDLKYEMVFGPGGKSTDKWNSK
jgi:hypothetical protein